MNNNKHGFEFLKPLWFSFKSLVLAFILLFDYLSQSISLQSRIFLLLIEDLSLINYNCLVL